MKDIKHELEIAMAIQKESFNSLARKWKVSHTHVRHTSMGLTKAEPTYKKIESFIEEAKKIVPFSYPNGKKEKLNFIPVKELSEAISIGRRGIQQWIERGQIKKNYYRYVNGLGRGGRQLEIAIEGIPEPYQSEFKAQYSGINEKQELVEKR